MKDYSEALTGFFGADSGEPVKVGSGKAVHLARMGYDCHGGERYIVLCGAGTPTSSVYSVAAVPTCAICAEEG